MKALHGWDTRIRDNCACGREKDTTQYVCEHCWNQGHPVKDSRAHGADGDHRATVVVVWDPTGDFRSGARFTGEEFGFAGGVRGRKTTQDMGYWPDGMILRKGDRLFAVEGKRVVEVEG